MPRKHPSVKPSSVLSFPEVCRLAKGLPGVEESTSYGTPALKVRGKLFARMKEDGETLVLRTEFLERDVLIRMAPKIFFITAHYLDYPWVLVRLSAMDKANLAVLLEDAWRRVAPPKVLREFEARQAARKVRARS